MFVNNNIVIYENVTRFWAFVVWVWMCTSGSQKIPLSVLALNPHKRLVREISEESGKRRGKEGLRHNRRRRTEKKPVDWTEQSAGESRMCNPEAWLVNVEDESAFLVTLWEFHSNTRRYSLQKARKVSQTSPFLCLELTQDRVCLFSFLPPSRLCMLCLCVVKKCEIPLPEMRETTRHSDSHEWFRRLR